MILVSPFNPSLPPRCLLDEDTTRGEGTTHPCPPTRQRYLGPPCTNVPPLDRQSVAIVMAQLAIHVEAS